MATTRKVLGQAAPGATTTSALYTVPASTQAVCSTLSVCNRGTAIAKVRVSVAPAGATLANSQYVLYDVPVAAADSLFLTLGITLAATDIVRVYASTADVTFSLFGAEES
jgi:hypothetical protein